MPVTLPFQASRKFFSTIGAGAGTGATFAIAATSFTNDSGVTATAFPTTFAYYILYVNGVIQLASASTISTTAITIPDANTLDPAMPLLVEFIIT